MEQMDCQEPPDLLVINKLIPIWTKVVFGLFVYLFVCFFVCMFVSAILSMGGAGKGVEGS